jgi:hypothetical protein
MLSMHSLTLRNLDQNKTIPNFNYSPKVAYPKRLYGIKIMRIHEIENLTLEHLCATFVPGDDRKFEFLRKSMSIKN